MTLRKARAGTTVEDLVRSIADAIISGRWSPGEKLDELSLARRFGVSRTPIREALMQLSAMELVDRRPNRGAVVAELSQKRLGSMFEAMAELEGVCARLAAERMTLSERYAFEAMHLASAQLVRQQAEVEYEGHNTRFHSAIYAGAHSNYLYDIVAATRSRLAPFRSAQFRLPERLTKSYKEHDAIVTAILRGDGKAAEAAARSHVGNVSDASSRLVEAVRSQKAPDEQQA
ncbi:MAG: GntR family transcriptional regulator [Alphaproteobacteria bacterium]|nr:GntR family transcriptional regulator [Alphaproteobacteria bacterium]